MKFRCLHHESRIGSAKRVARSGGSDHSQWRRLWPSRGYNGPITLSGYERFQYIRDMLQKEDISIPLPTGN